MYVKKQTPSFNSFFFFFAFHQIPFSKSDGPTGKNKQPDQFVLQRQIITIGARDKNSGKTGGRLDKKDCMHAQVKNVCWKIIVKILPFNFVGRGKGKV